MILATKELVNLLEECDAEYTNFRLANMKKTANNPLMIDIKTLGYTRAFKIIKWPDYYYGNKVLFKDSLENYREEEFDQIDTFFHDSNVSYRIEISPVHMLPEISHKIQSMNFYCSGYESVVIRSIDEPSSPKENNGIIISPLTLNDSLDSFLDVYQDGFEYKRFTQEEKEITKAWCNTNNPNLFLYGAYCDNKIVGLAIMFIWKNVAIMADATTLPDYRKRGIQKMFIQRRLQDAYNHNCDYATSYVGFGTPSHNNFLKMGFTTYYNKFNFTKKFFS